MTASFIIRTDEDSYCIIDPQNENALLTLKVNEWETNFFKKKVGKLIIDSNILKSLTEETVNDFLNRMIFFADENHYNIIELQLDIQALQFVPLFENKGFRLVDTRITFITLIDKKQIERYSSPIGEIGFATKNDLEDILDLTRQSFVYNPAFFSRYKNKNFFTKEESERFYLAWITNHIEDSDSWFVVIRKGQKVLGYFIYKDAGLYKDEKIYKGILTAVAPEYRGHKLHIFMQSYLYNQFPEDQFYIDSTTQLTNYATIKSHIRSQKNLSCIKLNFYRLESR